MKMKKQKLSIRLFYSLVIVGVMVISQFFIPPLQELLHGFIFLIPSIIFSLLGLALLITAVRENVKKKDRRLRKYFILTGVFSTGFFICILLHNFFYGLGILAKDITILRYLMEGLHVTFFLISTIVCPIGFLVGVIGSIILLAKKR